MIFMHTNLIKILEMLLKTRAKLKKLKYIQNSIKLENHREL